MPDCPHGLVPEIPLKLYHIYELKKLEIGCVVKSRDQNRKRTDQVTYENQVDTFFDEKEKKNKQTELLLYVIIGCLSGMIVCMMFAYFSYVATRYKVLKGFFGNQLLKDP